MVPFCPSCTWSKMFRNFGGQPNSSVFSRVRFDWLCQRPLLDRRRLHIGAMFCSRHFFWVCLAQRKDYICCTSICSETALTFLEAAFSCDWYEPFQENCGKYFTSDGKKYDTPVVAAVSPLLLYKETITATRSSSDTTPCVQQAVKRSLSYSMMTYGISGVEWIRISWKLNISAAREQWGLGKLKCSMGL